MKMLLCALMLLPTLSWAQAKGADSGFEQRKKEALSNAEQMITNMQSHKSCISGAADQPALQACREKMREMRMEFRDEHMDRRHERMESRRKEMEERRNQRKEKGK